MSACRRISCEWINVQCVTGVIYEPLFFFIAISCTLYSNIIKLLIHIQPRNDEQYFFLNYWKTITTRHSINNCLHSIQKHFIFVFYFCGAVACILNMKKVAIVGISSSKRVFIAWLIEMENNSLLCITWMYPVSREFVAMCQIKCRTI